MIHPTISISDFDYLALSHSHVQYIPVIVPEVGPQKIGTISNIHLSDKFY